MNLRDDIKYIKSGSLSNLYVNGEKADRISVTVMTVGQDGTISPVSYTHLTLPTT